MNRIHQSAWKQRQSSSRTSPTARFALKGLAVSLMLAFGTGVYALPTGGTVSAGSASIAGGAGTMTVNQSSQNAAINWQSFSIGQTEAVNFVQPNSSSVALNRVLGPDPSNILGSLSANGKVFMVNPNGILFAKGAQVNVAGLVASTRNISDGDFMAGNYRFSGSGTGTVVNQGSINANGGYVALLGASVSNEGVIVAKLGTVALAAGNAFTLDVAGDGLLNVVVSQGALNALAENGGLIRADGGQVLLTALSAGNLLQSAVNNTGIIQAQTVENHNGTIRLVGDMQSGTVNVGGTLDVSGTGAGQTGGSVTATGNHVGLFGGQINASGDAGGGTVLIGGGYQGNNPAVQNASATYMSPDSTINVDAITNGNGGTAVLWSNDSTRAQGSVTARGGAQGGDGGLIETSAHSLDVIGFRVNAGAPNGKAGTWLLDPADVTIGVGDVGVTNTAGVYSPNSNVSAANVDAAQLIIALGLTNITITTTNTGAPGTPSNVAPNSGLGDITVAAALAWGGATTLTLNAAGDVNINAAITPSPGNLVVCCGRDINVRSTIAATGGSVLLSAGRDITLFAGGAITTVVGNLTMCAGHDVNVIGKITMTSAGTGVGTLGLPGGLVLSAGNAATGPGLAGGGGSVFLPAGGPLRPELTRASATPMDVAISYNPASYTVPPLDYSSQLILNTPTITLTQNRLVFPGGADRVFDGTTTALFTSLQGNPAGVTLGNPGTATFASAGPGVGIPITYSGVTLGGATAGFALPTACCGVVTRTTGTITAAAIPAAPGIVPPVIVALPADAVGVPVPVLLPVFYPYAVLAGMDLTVEGIRMPPIARAPEVIPPPPVVVPPAPPVVVPRPLPPRRPRN